MGTVQSPALAVAFSNSPLRESFDLLPSSCFGNSELLINLHVRHSIRTDPSAVHPLGVERCREVAFAVEDDRAAVAADRLQLLVDHLVAGLFDRHSFVLIK